MEDAVLALVGVILGGAGTKFIEKLFENKHKRKVAELQERKTDNDVALNIREELRHDITILRKEMDDLHQEIDEWRNKYYTLLADYSDIKVKYKALQGEVDALKAAQN